jgi:hypothetical protein
MMTEEHKAKLAEGRRLAREAKVRRQREAAISGRGGGASRSDALGPPPAAAAVPLPVAVTGNLRPGGVPSADTLEQIARIVKTYHAAGLGKGKPFEEMLGLAVRGWEIGVPPGEAIAGMYVSEEGTEAMTAELMRAQVYRSGGRLPVLEQSDQRCVLQPERDGRVFGQVVFTIEDAKRQGLLSQKHWQTMPRQMLFARATSEAIRQVFSDVVRGVSYTPEEVGVKAAPVGGEGAGSAVSRGSAPAGAVPSAAVSPSTGGGSPPPASVAPSPGNGGKHSERALSVQIKIPTPGDASNLREVLTAGITADQIAMLQSLTGKQGGYPDWQEKQARARAYFAKWGLKVDLRFLTKDEADALVAELSFPPRVEAPAETMLNEVISRLDLEPYRAEIVQMALTKWQVLTLGEMTREQGKQLATQVEAMATDRAAFPHLLAQLRQQEGMV